MPDRRYLFGNGARDYYLDAAVDSNEEGYPHQRTAGRKVLWNWFITLVSERYQISIKNVSLFAKWQWQMAI